MSGQPWRIWAWGLPDPTGKSVEVQESLECSSAKWNVTYPRPTTRYTPHGTKPARSGSTGISGSCQVSAGRYQRSTTDPRTPALSRLNRSHAGLI